MIMKRRSFVLLLACVCLWAVSCQNSKKKNTPEAAVESFAKAFYTADFPHMYQYTTKRSHVLLQSMQNGMRDKESRLEKMKNSQVEILGINVLEQNDSAAVCDCQVTIDGQPRHDKWDLMKEDEVWKVTLAMP